MENSKKQRLSKVMAAAGVASRRACEELIFSGRVRVNGAVTKQQIMVSDQDVILVDNKPISSTEEKVYYILNKPTGYICSTRGTANSKLVLSLFEEEVKQRLFTIGRLDKDTAGLLLVTNDGHFANRVIHPSSNISKEYLAKTDHEITPEHLAAISNGTLVEGVFVKPLRVTKVRRGTVKITVAEGKKREVRLLLENAGLQVLELTRIRIGGLQLGPLPTGSWRPLTEKEQESIFE